MESALSRFLVGLSVQISRSDGELIFPQHSLFEWIVNTLTTSLLVTGKQVAYIRPRWGLWMLSNPRLWSNGTREKSLVGRRLVCPYTQRQISKVSKNLCGWWPGTVFQVLVTELCALNPELMDYINNVTSNAANPPRPAPEKVNVALLLT